MYIQFKEPVQSHYLLPNLDNSTLRFIMPFPSDANQQDLKNFWTGEHSALKELEAYQKALEFDLNLLSEQTGIFQDASLGALRELKKFRLTLIKQYIKNINDFLTHQLANPAANYRTLKDLCNHKNDKKITIERSGHFKGITDDWLEFVTLVGNTQAPDLLSVPPDAAIPHISKVKVVPLKTFLSKGEPSLVAEFLFLDTTDENGIKQPNNPLFQDSCRL